MVFIISIFVFLIFLSGVLVVVAQSFHHKLKAASAFKLPSDSPSMFISIRS